MARRPWIAALAFALLLAAPSCTSEKPSSVDAGVDAADDVTEADAPVDAGTDEAAVYSCRTKPFDLDRGCNECIVAKCCGPLFRCFNDTECREDVVPCMQACDAADADTACKDACTSAHTAGRARYDEVYGCRNERCAGPCRLYY